MIHKIHFNYIIILQPKLLHHVFLFDIYVAKKAGICVYRLLAAWVSSKVGQIPNIVVDSISNTDFRKDTKDIRILAGLIGF